MGSLLAHLRRTQEAEPEGGTHSVSAPCQLQECHLRPHLVCLLRTRHHCGRWEYWGEWPHKAPALRNTPPRGGEPSKKAYKELRIRRYVPGKNKENNTP